MISRRVALACAAVMLTTACAPDPPAAIVGIVVDSCDPGQELGSGALVAPGLVLTSAHVVAGADEILVRRDGVDMPAVIVGFDPEMDLAYLDVDLAAAELPAVSSDHIRAGDTGVAYVVRGGEVHAVPVTIRRRVRIRTEDIYIEGEVFRPGFEMDADITSGDSGGAIVVDGRIVGVIWARSNKFEQRAYAIDAVRAADTIDAQRRTGDLGPDVDIARCH